MKKAIIWMLIASLLLTILTSCNNRPSDESKDETTPTTEQTENPPSNQISNEEKYKPVLDIYEDIIINLDEQLNSTDRPYSEGTQEYEWWSAILGAAGSYHLSTTAPGYAFCDLNQNGNDELLLLLDDYTTLAIFSFTNDKPVLLDNYWNRKKCTIDEDGTLQVYGGSGAGTSSFSIFKISDNDKELVLLEEYGTDGYNADTGIPYYYKILDGTKTPITVLEYAAALSQGIYPSVGELAKHTKQNAKFDFVPLGLEISYKRIFERILKYDSKITSANKYLWEFLQYFGSSSMGDPNIIEICYLDMDGDGTVELLLRSNLNDYLMLRYQSGSVCLYNLPYKSIDRVYEDGSYDWHSPTYLEDDSINYGVSRVYFKESEQKFKSIYTIYDGENESYFTINGKLASKSELDSLVESRKDIKEVTWTTYTLDPNKIPAKG